MLYFVHPFTVISAHTKRDIEHTDSQENCRREQYLGAFEAKLHCWDLWEYNFPPFSQAATWLWLQGFTFKWPFQSQRNAISASSVESNWSVCWLVGLRTARFTAGISTGNVRGREVFLKPYFLAGYCDLIWNKIMALHNITDMVRQAEMKMSEIQS